ncbi:MAG TPA: Cof-type HAD-IIB family hydrolase [Candidatus Salinicoccus merdavium]|nr:Cof-type HAD-IIB family hydrolase [Candidatus Salinicoccus merdavium]
MVKLIAIDMDGTLLTPEHSITPRTILAINKALEQGIQVVIATGRAFYEAHGIVREYDLNIPYICLNGAQIRNEQHEIVENYPMNNELITEVTDVFKSEDVFYQVYTDRAIYTTSIERDIDIFIELAEQSGGNPDVEKIRRLMRERMAKTSLKEVENYREIYEREDEHVLKFLAASSNKPKLIRTKSYLNEIDQLAVSSSSYGNVEVTRKDAQKGIALEKIAEELNVDLKDAMAIGDNLNDISMLKRAGTAVAMGNATSEVKAIADVVTGTNIEDGVATAIENILNNEYENTAK